MMTADRPKTKNFSISLPEDLIARLDALVGFQGYRSRSQVIAKLIEEKLDEMDKQNEA